MHADGFAGFNGLFGEGKADEQACMVHVRRKFVEEFERTGAAIAKGTIKQIAVLYAVEEQARDKSTEECVALRQAKAKPVFDELEAWLQAQLPGLSGKNRLARAIRHARNRMPKAPACLGDGRLELDNNIRQRSIRPIALGHWCTGPRELSLHGRRHCLHTYRDRQDERRCSRSMAHMAHMGARMPARSQNQ